MLTLALIKLADYMKHQILKMSYSQIYQARTLDIFLVSFENSN